MAVDPNFRAQMDEVFSQATGGRRKPREDEYEQWGGAGGYAMKDDIDGTGKRLAAWSGGDIDPYWKSRMTMHATGDYNGDGTTPSDANSSRAGGGRMAMPAIMASPQMPTAQAIVDQEALMGLMTPETSDRQFNPGDLSTTAPVEPGIPEGDVPLEYQIHQPIAGAGLPSQSARVQEALAWFGRGKPKQPLDQQALLSMMAPQAR